MRSPEKTIRQEQMLNIGIAAVQRIIVYIIAMMFYFAPETATP